VEQVLARGQLDPEEGLRRRHGRVEAAKVRVRVGVRGRVRVRVRVRVRGRVRGKVRVRVSPRGAHLLPAGRVSKLTPTRAPWRSKCSLQPPARAAGRATACTCMCSNCELAMYLLRAVAEVRGRR